VKRWCGRCFGQQEERGVTQQEDLSGDAFLKDVPDVDGFKVLEPCVLYAKVGQGGMGAVYRGKHLNLDLDVGVKCLLPRLAGGNEQLVLRFEREARLAARISHPNLVRVFDVDERHGIHYLVMEFVKGETARERVARKGRLPLGEAVTIVLEASKGLAAAHAEGIVHRDIKPDNILISHEGDVKLADLGLGRMHQQDPDQTAADGLTMPHVTMGTPRYMPPEQWESLSKVGPAGDVWALGATLYFLLVGEDAYTGDTRNQIMCRVCLEEFPDITQAVGALPTPFLSVLRKCTARDPDVRYRHAGELASALEDVVKANSLTGSLDDDETGTGTARCTMVSPPPPELLAKVRLTLDSEREMRTASRTRSRAEDSAETRSFVGSVSDAKPAASRTDHDGSRRRYAPVAVAFIVVLAAGLGLLWAFGAFDPASDPEPAVESVAHGPSAPAIDAGNETPRDRDDADPSGADVGRDPGMTPAPAPDAPGTPEDVEDPTRARIAAHLASSESLLRSADSLPDAVRELDALLALDPQHEEGRRRLALALSRLAESAFEAGQLADAYQHIVRSRENGALPIAERLALDITRALRRRVEDDLSVVEPRADAIVTAASILVRGTVDAGGIVRAVEVGGRPAQFAAGRFDAMLDGLDEGTHDVPIAVTVDGGYTVDTSFSVTVDRTAPRLEGLDLAPRAWVEPTFPLSGTVRDASAVALRVNDRDVALQPDGSFQTAVTIASATARDAQVVHIEATDAAGLVTTDAIPVRVDRSEPRLEVLAPRREGDGGMVWTRDKRVEVRVRVVEDGELREVRIGDSLAELQQGDVWAATVPLLADGRFRFPILAVDGAGREARDEIEVGRDTLQPKLDLSDPTKGAISKAIRSGVLQVSGTLEDDSSCRIEVNGVKITVTGGTWKVEVPIDESTTQLEVVATDEADNATKIVQAIRVEKDGAAGDPVAPKTVEPDRAPAVAGFTWRAKNAQGRHEYRHDRTGIVMVLLPGGKFSMGKLEAEMGLASERPPHEVSVSPFLIAKFELCQVELRAVGGVNHSTFRHDPRLPVENVTWKEARDLCMSVGLALPTEAEWEFACRAGTKTPFSFGANINTSLENFNGQYPYRDGAKGTFRGKTMPVGSLKPNGFGLHGLHGNVMEWCEDIFDERFYSRPEASGADPLATSGSTLRAVRGGSWYHHATGCRSASRQGLNPDGRYYMVGFRPVYRVR